MEEFFEGSVNFNQIPQLDHSLLTEELISYVYDKWRWQRYGLLGWFVTLWKLGKDWLVSKLTEDLGDKYYLFVANKLEDYTIKQQKAILADFFLFKKDPNHKNLRLLDNPVLWKPRDRNGSLYTRYEELRRQLFPPTTIDFSRFAGA